MKNTARMGTTLCGWLIAVACVLSALGCKDPLPGESLELVSLRVYAVAVDLPEEDPYQGVTFLRLAVTDEDGHGTDKFVHISEGAAAALDEVPFGSGLQVTVEGWSQNSDGLIGHLISRGRSTVFSVSDDSNPQTISVLVSRVNEFARTTTRTEAGSQATSMAVGRIGHTVTELPGGRVLITGGAQLLSSVIGDYTAPSDIQQVFADAEIYDPATGAFFATTAMAIPRAFHTATPLADGRVLIAGGVIDQAGTTSPDLEVYDPNAGSFQILVGAKMNTARAGHTATRIDNSDHILVAGGFTTGSSALGTLEVMCLPGSSCAENSGTGVIFTQNLAEPRYFHTATRTRVGQDTASLEAVLLIGGEGDTGVRSTVETFVLNPAGMSDLIAEMPAGPRTRHTSNYVDAQKFVHVVGGFSDREHSQGVLRIDSYQVQQQGFQTQQEFYAMHARGAHAAVNMPNNAILIIGGFDGGEVLNKAEVIFEYYDESTGQTYIDRGGVAAMRAARGGLHGLLLPNETVLVVGGIGAGATPVTMGEFFNPL